MDDFNCLAWLTEPWMGKKSLLLELFKALTEDCLPCQGALQRSVLLWAFPQSFFIVSILVRRAGHSQYNTTLCYLLLPHDETQARPFLAATDLDDKASLTQYNTSPLQHKSSEGNKSLP